MPNPENGDENSELLMERAERLKEALRRAGGGAAIARQIGMPVPTLNNYLAGRDMKASALVSLAIATGVSVEWLATGVEPDRAATSSEGSVFGGDMMLRPVNFWLLVILLRSCQEAFSRVEKPSLKEVIEWIAPSYRRTHAIPDMRIELKDPEDSQ